MTTTLASSSLVEIDCPSPTGEDPLEHVKYAIANTPVSNYPYPHIHVRNVFPRDYYRQIRAHFPEQSTFKPLSERYPLRGKVCLSDPDGIAPLDTGAKDDFWSDFRRRFIHEHFTSFVLDHFSPILASRFRQNVRPDAYLFQDRGGYAIGTHTDTTRKLVTMLFYLPEEDAPALDVGTSIVVPEDPACRRLNLPHQESLEGFKVAKTVPFEANSMIAFVVTDESMHAVLPTPEGTVRDSLQYFINTPK